MRRFVTVLILSGTLAVAAFAGGRQESTPISIQVTQTGRTYISPNGDGVRDTLDVGTWFSIDRGDDPDAQRAIKVLEVAVFGTEEDLAGQEVWQRRTVETAQRTGLRNLLNIGDEPGVALPEELSWDGSFLGSAAGDDGSTVPDGDYIFQLSIVDETGALTRTPPLNVTVDTTSPVISELSPDTTIFSPNDDGVRDLVTIQQSLSSEQQWIAEIVSSVDQETVRSYTFQNTAGSRSADVAPSRVTWDGRTDQGSLAPEGAYRYRITGTDRAGNTATGSFGPISLSLTGGDIQLTATRPVFSPNEDGIYDTVEFQVAVSEPQGIVSWQVTVAPADQLDTPERSFGGDGEPPESITFDGTTDSGIALPDGAYEAAFQIEYSNGNRVVAEPVAVAVDTTAPSGRVRAQTVPTETDLTAGVPFAFGGPEKPRLAISVDLSPEDAWIGVLEREAGAISAPLAELGITGTSLDLEWDGTDTSGNEVPDGRYSLYLHATDEAGNTGRTNRVTAIKNTQPVSVTISPQSAYVSPNSDGVMESIVLDIQYVDTGLIDDFLLSITDSLGRVMRSQYRNQPFAQFEWFGRSNGNSVLPDGTYSASIEVIYYNGARASAEVGGLRIDTTPPRVERFSIPYTLFSPDGDGDRDTLPIEQRTSTEREWSGRIVPGTGEGGRDPVFAVTWRGQAGSFAWDGTDERGIVVPDGDYTYVLTSVDRAGNATRFERAIVVDTRVMEEPPPAVEAEEPVVTTTRRPAAAMTVFPVPFTPDGNGTNDILTISMIAEATVELARWELDILGPTGAVVRQFGGEGRPPRTVTWDGRTSDGELVQSAEDYAAVLTVVDAQGAQARADALIPVGILVIRDGDNYRIMVPSINFAPFSANLFDVPQDRLQKNLETLRDLARVLKRFPQYDITVEGHAVHQVFDPLGRDIEQRDELVPLSTARAEEVRQALIILGVERDRMDIVGYGGARPVVPHEDFEDQWRNRRVEFLLQQE